MEPVIEPGMTSGQRIKLYRTRVGLTQEVCAQLKGCSLSAWRKWESGERQVLALHDWIEIARILRVKDMFRLTGLPVGQLPDEPSEHESAGPIRDALHAYAHRDEPVDLPALRTTTEFAWDTWQSSPNRFSRTGPLLPDLIRQARTAAAVADESRQREAHQLLATVYMLVRSYCKRIGALDLSHLAADRGMVAARIVDDPAYMAAAAWNLAMVLSTQGHPEAAATLARDAIAELNRCEYEPDAHWLAASGSLHLVLAIQEARLRNAHATLNALDHADRAASVTGETNLHRTVFGPTNVSIHRSAASMELSRVSEARRLAERVDVSGLPSVERRFTHYLDLARGFAFGREDLSAVHMLNRAENESPEEAKLNVVFRAVVRDLLNRETPTLRPELRPLAQRVGVA